LVFYQSFYYPAARDLSRTDRTSAYPLSVRCFRSASNLFTNLGLRALTSESDRLNNVFAILTITLFLSIGRPVVHLPVSTARAMRERLLLMYPLSDSS